MEIEGLMNVLPRVSFPGNLTLELHGVVSLGKAQHGAPRAPLDPG